MATVLIPLAEGFEELEAVTLIDLLRRADIEVITASLDGQTVTASRGTRVVADTSVDEVLEQDFDMVVLPGGLPGADHLDADDRIHGILQRAAENDRPIGAICAAPKVLASGGLLDHKKATAYPGVLDPKSLGSTQITDAAVQQDGNILTSRGPGTAMDFALEIIACLAGADKRNEVEAALLRS